VNERWTPKNLKDYPPNKFAEMLKRWLQDPLSEPELEEWYVTGEPHGIPFCEREPEQWERDHKKYSPIYQKAAAFEKIGDYEKALSLYMQILSKYIPHGTVYYERPTIILERMAKYKEAVAICNVAIFALENRLFNADIELFRKRKARLEKKMTAS
jgi:tetratricopeptide (TPR) repeat protein